MTLPDTAPSRKPRRLGLYAPFALLAAAIAIWTVIWFSLAAQVAGRLEASRADLAKEGYQVDWSARAIGGYPFRLDVTLTGARLRAASGWGLATPTIKAEAFAYLPSHWVIVAPVGLDFTPQYGGTVAIRATALRASLSEAQAHPPRLSVEGIGLSFATPPGAPPFFITGADAFHQHTRAGPDDQGGLYLELDQAHARFPGLIGRISQGRPVTLIADGVYSHADALKGPTWTAAVRAWSAAGGAMTLRDLRITAGQSQADGRGILSVGADGRLAGVLSARLTQIFGRGQTGGSDPQGATIAKIVFQAGKARLGPLTLAPAPRIY